MEVEHTFTDLDPQDSKQPKGQPVNSTELLSLWCEQFNGFKEAAVLSELGLKPHEIIDKLIARKSALGLAAHANALKQQKVEMARAGKEAWASRSLSPQPRRVLSEEARDAVDSLAAKISSNNSHSASWNDATIDTPPTNSTELLRLLADRYEGRAEVDFLTNTGIKPHEVLDELIATKRFLGLRQDVDLLLSQKAEMERAGKDAFYREKAKAQPREFDAEVEAAIASFAGKIRL